MTEEAAKLNEEQEESVGNSNAGGADPASNLMAKAGSIIAESAREGSSMVLCCVSPLDYAKNEEEDKELQSNDNTEDDDKNIKDDTSSKSSSQQEKAPLSPPPPSQEENSRPRLSRFSLSQRKRLKAQKKTIITVTASTDTSPPSPARNTPPSRPSSYKIPPPSSKEYRKEFLDPLFWHPESPNFTIIDWKKWYAQNPTVPKVYDPPQRSTLLRGLKSIPMWWWTRSCYFQPLAFWCRSCIAPNKPQMERISDVESGALFTGLLGRHPNPENVPEPLRNKLLWTRHNIAPETLVSFNRWAWRAQTAEGRVIGLGDLEHDWTDDTSMFGVCFARGQKNLYANVQMSPDGKWILVNAFRDPTKNGVANYLWMYVVQKDDVFTYPDGGVLDFVKPGDLLRLSWNGEDPYDVDPSKLNYEYFPRVVATLNEERGTVDMVEENFSELLEKATADPGCGTCLTTCGYSCSCCMAGEDRFDLQVSYLSDRQIFDPAATPPESGVIDRL